MQSELKQLFEQRYQKWLDARAKWIKQNPSAPYLTVLPEEQAVLGMGGAIVPFIIEKFDSDLSDPSYDNRLLADQVKIMRKLTAKAFSKSDWPEGLHGRHDAEEELYVNWWKYGRKNTAKDFLDIYAEWDRFSTAGETKEADKKLNEMRDMGFDILPLVIQKISDGDKRLLPLINKLMRKKVVDDNSTRESVLEWWKSNESLLRLPDLPAKSSPK